MFRCVLPLQHQHVPCPIRSPRERGRCEKNAGPSPPLLKLSDSLLDNLRGSLPERVMLSHAVFWWSVDWSLCCHYGQTPSKDLSCEEYDTYLILNNIINMYWHTCTCNSKTAIHLRPHLSSLRMSLWWQYFWCISQFTRDFFKLHAERPSLVPSPGNVDDVLPHCFPFQLLFHANKCVNLISKSKAWRILESYSKLDGGNQRLSTRNIVRCRCFRLLPSW